MIDYHIHSEFSVDASGYLGDFCKKGIELGLEGIGFSEHVDFDPRDRGFGFFSNLHFGRNLNLLNAIYGNNIKIFKGVEITYQPQYLNEIEEFIESVKLDYTIGSIHFLGDWIISSSDKKELEKFSRYSERDVYNTYFKELKELVTSGLFNIVGHFDIISRYGTGYFGAYEPDNYREIIFDILKIMIDRGMILEVNTSGFRKGPGTIYPHPKILRYYRELGGEIIVLGSDAHHPEMVGRDFKKAVNIIREVGLEYCPIFDDGEILKIEKIN